MTRVKVKEGRQLSKGSCDHSWYDTRQVGYGDTVLVTKYMHRAFGCSKLLLYTFKPPSYLGVHNWVIKETFRDSTLIGFPIRQLNWSNMTLQTATRCRQRFVLQVTRLASFCRLHRFIKEIWSTNTIQSVCSVNKDLMRQPAGNCTCFVCLSSSSSLLPSSSLSSS